MYIFLEPAEPPTDFRYDTENHCLRWSRAENALGYLLFWKHKVEPDWKKVRNGGALSVENCFFETTCELEYSIAVETCDGVGKLAPAVLVPPGKCH